MTLKHRRTARIGAALLTLAAAAAIPAGVRADGDKVDDRLRQLERSLAEERARNAANEAALRALQDRLDGAGGRGAEAGGADGAVDDDRVRKIVREMLADKKVTDDIRKSFGVVEAGFRKPVDYQGSAFFIKGGDDFQLNINGRAQLRYYYTAFNRRDQRDGINVAPPQKGVNPNLLNWDDRSDIAVGRFRMHFSGFVHTKNITYSLQIDSSTRGNDAVVIDEAWVNWNVFGGNSDVPVEFRDALQVRFGQYYTVWGRFERQAQFQSQSSWAFQTMDFPPATAFFFPDRNPGLEIRGVVGGVNGGSLGLLGLVDNNLPEDRPGTKGWLEYNVAVTNGWQSAGRRYGYENDTAAGVPTTARETDIRPAIVARVGLDMLKGRFIGQDGKEYYIFGRNQGDMEQHETPALGMGASFAWMRMRGQDRPLNNVPLGAFYRPPTPTDFSDDFADSFWFAYDAAFKWQGFSLQGELYYNKIKALPNSGGALNNTQSQDIWGWYIQPGYFVCPHTLELYYQWSGVNAGRTPVLTQSVGGVVGPQPLAGTNAPYNHTHVFGVNWYPFQSVNVKLTAEGALLFNNPVASSRAGWVQASRENQFQARFQVQVGF